MANQLFLIIGKVLDEQTRHPIPAVYVEAWDKDRIYDDLIGGAMTNESGEFKFRFDETYFQELFLDRQPDIYFKVKYKDKVVKSTEDSVLWNLSGTGKNLDIYIDRKDVQAEEATIIAKAMDFPMEDVLAQYATEEKLPLSMVREHERELKRFLALASITHKDYGIAGPIGRLWKTFLTFTYLYLTFTRRVNVAFLHHFPYTPQNKFPKRRLEDIKRSYETMRKDYQVIYKEEPPLHLWLPLADLPDDTTWGWIDDSVLVFTSGDGVSGLGGVHGQDCDCCAAVSGTE